MPTVATLPTGATETIETKFGNYLNVATKDLDGPDGKYSKDDLAGITTLAKTLSQTLEVIQSDATLPSDKTHKLKKLNEVTSTLVVELKDKVNKKYDDQSEPQRVKLFEPFGEVSNASEIRALYSDLAGDPVALSLVAPQLSDQVFDALRSAPAKPLISKRNGMVNSVTLVPYVDSGTEFMELNRRRPEIAARLAVFKDRKRSFEGVANTLGQIVKQHVESALMGF